MKIKFMVLLLVVLAASVAYSIRGKNIDIDIKIKDGFIELKSNLDNDVYIDAMIAADRDTVCYAFTGLSDARLDEFKKKKTMLGMDSWNRADFPKSLLLKSGQVLKIEAIEKFGLSYVHELPVVSVENVFLDEKDIDRFIVSGHGRIGTEDEYRFMNTYYFKNGLPVKTGEYEKPKLASWQPGLSAEWQNDEILIRNHGKHHIEISSKFLYVWVSGEEYFGIRNGAGGKIDVRKNEKCTFGLHDVDFKMYKEVNGESEAVKYNYSKNNRPDSVRFLVEVPYSDEYDSKFVCLEIK